VNLPHCIFAPYRFGRFATKPVWSIRPKQSSVAKLFMMKSAALCDADGVQVNWIGLYGSPRVDRKLYGSRLHMFICRSLTLLTWASVNCNHMPFGYGKCCPNFPCCPTIDTISPFICSVWSHGYAIAWCVQTFRSLIGLK
jgi:hypothetical protein